MAAGSLHDVVAFNVVAFGTLVIVVIPLRIVRSLGMPRAFVTHKFTSSIKRRAYRFALKRGDKVW